MAKQNLLNRGITTPVGILVIVIVALAAGGIFYWQWSGLKKVEPPEVRAPATEGPKEILPPPPPGEEEEEEETADWKTYRNEEYGFELKYPSAPSGCERCAIKEVGKDITLGTISLSILDSRGLSLSEFVENELQEARRVFDVSTQKISIGGEEGIDTSYDDVRLSFLENNGKIYKFILGYGDSCCYEIGAYEINAYDQILSTFKFID